MKYNKPFLNVEEQIELLKARGLVVADNKLLKDVLMNISYYRLSAYLFPYRIHNDKNQRFIPNTSFDKVIKIYSFDRKLRLLLFDAIERIEIAFRTQLTLSLGKEYGSYWYSNKDIFANIDKFDKSIENLKREYKSSREVFIKHFKNKYDESELPPSWIALEIFSFGQLSHHYSNLRYKQDKQLVADYFELKYPVFESWLHSFSYVRNICAHHSRLWNRSLGVRPNFPNKKHFSWLTNKNINNNRAYYLLCTLQYILNIVHKRNSFKNKLTALMQDYDMIDFSPMGFPDNWQEENLWRKD